jgi:hypothetical protein
VNLNELLGDPAWLFDLGVPIRSLAKRVAKPDGLEWQLGQEFAMPALSSLSGGKEFAKVYLAWTGTGFYFQAVLKSDKRRSLASEANNFSRTAHISLYLDTRWSPGVHRATSFCHRFDFFLKRPTESEPTQRGHGELVSIQRARASPTEVHPSQISVVSIYQPGGYDIKAYLPSATLTGFAPDEYQDFGIYYTLNDPVFGTQIMARTLQSPYFEDPSVWCRARLIPTQD